MLKKNINQSIVAAMAQQATFAARFAQPNVAAAVAKQVGFAARFAQPNVAAAVAKQVDFAARFAQPSVAAAVAKQVNFAARFAQPNVAAAVAKQVDFAARFAPSSTLANAIAQQFAIVNKISQNMTFSEQLTYCATLQEILVSVTTDQHDDTWQHLNFPRDGVNNSSNNSNPEILKSDIQLSSQEEQELNETIKEVIEQKPNWEQNLVARLENYKESHPVIYKALVIILGTILVPIIVNYCSNLISLKSEPSPKSEIVTVVPADQVRIMNVSQNYYYEVEYFDEEIQEFQTAWIGKGKLNSIIKNNIDKEGSDEI